METRLTWFNHINRDPRCAAPPTYAAAVARWIQAIVELVQRVQAAQRERDPVAGRTQTKERPTARRVDHGVRVEYSPEIDGEADPGEVVWAWVPYQEDPNRGKDRPVVVIGRATGADVAGDRLVGVPLTSKKKRRADHVPVGTGGWDPQGRPSWAKVDRLIEFDGDDVRREGSVLDRNRFDDVVGNLARYHDLVRS